MEAKEKKAAKIKFPKYSIGGVISDDVVDRGNDPFFLKKAEDAKAFINKHGLPKEFTRKR